MKKIKKQQQNQSKEEEKNNKTDESESFQNRIKHMVKQKDKFWKDNWILYMERLKIIYGKEKIR